MNHRIPFYCLMLSCLFMGRLTAEEPGWNHYEPILQSGMFPQAVTARATEVRPVLSRPVPRVRWELDYRLTALFEDKQAGEIMIGVQHIPSSRSFLLRQGEQVPAEKLQFVRCQSTGSPFTVDLSRDGDVRSLTLADPASPARSENIK